jgi:two-component system cell cycle sensor histidine kinase PleC
VGRALRKAKTAKDGMAASTAVPVGMLSLLLAAFGGALALKAYEERQASEAATLTQQAREADALASHIRAELVSSRARMEGLLLTGASLETLRKSVPFEAVSMRDPPPGSWAQLGEGEDVRVFAQNKNGEWVSGVRSGESLMRQTAGANTLSLAPTSAVRLGSHFLNTDEGRRATACSPVPDTAIATCVARPAPLVNLGDLNRILIYGLVLAAPILAVIGLMGTIRRLQKSAQEAERLANRQKNAFDPAVLRAFETPGLIGMWRWDMSTHLLTIGPEAAQLVGASRYGEMTLDEFTSLVSEDERRKVQSAFEGVRPTQRIDVAFGGAHRTSGQYFEMMGAASEGAISGAITNVTDRVQAQHRSRRAEALARTALDAHPGPFAVWDSRKRLTHWNGAFSRIFNLDKSVIQTGASYDLVMSEISKFIRVERPTGDDTNSREILLLSDQWIRLVDRRTANDGLITVGLDITGLKRQEATTARSERRLRSMVSELERTRGQAQELAAQYAEARVRAERASQAKSVFLGNMSHELRTPLNAINGFSELLVKEMFGPLGDPRYKGYAEDILASGEHLLDIINDILDMAKIESGKMEISTKPIDPSDAVDSAVRLIRRRAGDKGVALDFDPDDDLPDINGDHRAIKQMTLNLIANAIKFTDAGGHIRVTVSHEGDWIVVRVADTGVGIHEADLPRLGQPFEQAKSPDGRQTQGTGLGLALTKSFAEMHGGYLSIASTVGKGTTVSIYLPIPPADKNAPPPSSPQSRLDA